MAAQVVVWQAATASRAVLHHHVVQTAAPQEFPVQGLQRRVVVHHQHRKAPPVVLLEHVAVEQVPLDPPAAADLHLLGSWPRCTK